MKSSAKLALKSNHGWKAKPGFRICVLDRGAVRFDFPEDWILKQAPDSVKIHDAEPPSDNCVLAISVYRLPPIDWSGLPVRDLVTAAMDGDDREILDRIDVVEEKRGELELAWGELRYRDPTENREAGARICIAREREIQCLLTLDFWADEKPRLDPVWSEVLRSLVLGLYVEDPTVGPVIH